MVKNFQQTFRFLLISILILVGLFAPFTVSHSFAAASTGSSDIGGGASGIPTEVNHLMRAVLDDNINNNRSLETFIGNIPFIRCDTNNKNCKYHESDNGVMGDVFSYFTVGLGGIPVFNSTVTNSTGQSQTYNIYPPGAIGTTINLTAQLYKHSPASSVEYIADVVNNVKHPFAQQAYAQGLGFSSLAPVLELWKIFRNIAYVFFVVIFVLVGFLIMIRAKIGSQAAVTVQQILPQLVVSLILVTFSYAIAGLLLDVMNILIFLIIGIFQNTTIGPQFDLRAMAFKNDIFTNGISLITNGVAQTIGGGMGKIVQSVITNLIGTQGLNDALAKGVGGLTSVVFTLVLVVALLVSLFRVFIALLQAYVGIFFSVIFAPIFLMLGALPGQNAFQKWIKGLLENILVFPMIVLMIFLAYFFTKGGTFDATKGGFSAPQLGSNQGEGGFAVYQSLIALGVILAMPEVMKVTKGIMKGELGVSVDDLKKNFDAGRAGAKRLALAPLDAAAGGVVGAYAGHKLGGGWRTTLGAGLGAAGGAITGIPTKNAPLIVREGTELLAKFGTAQAGAYIKRQSEQAETKRRLEEARKQASADTVARNADVKADVTQSES